MSHSRMYLFTAIALIVLAAVTFGVSYLPLGDLELPFALLIAVVKAALVGLFFMHLIDEMFVSRMVVLVSALLVVLLVSLIAVDMGEAVRPALPPLSRP